MRLVIRPRSAMAGTLVASLGDVMIKPIAQTDQITKTFKTVESKIRSMDGGVGNLQTTIDQLNERINKEENPKVEKMYSAGKKLGMFLVHAGKVDRQVANMVAVNQKEFFAANPWAIPPAPPKKKSLGQRIKEGFKKLGKKIAGGFKKAVKWVVKTAKKVWKKTVDFCKKHWKAIVKVVVGVVVIAGLAALSVFTGGAAAPLFALAAKGAAIAACTSAATTVVTGVIQGKSAGEIFDSSANSFLVGSITGAVSGVAGAAAGSVTSATGSQVLGELTKIGIETGGKILAEGSSYLIDNGTLKGFYDAKGKDILKGGASSALSAAGGYLMDTGKSLISNTFGGLKESQLVNSFKNAYTFCEQQAPTVTKVITGTVKDTFGNMSISDLTKLKNPSQFAKEIGGNLLDNFKSNAIGAVSDYAKEKLGGAVAGSGAFDKIDGLVGGIANSDAVQTVGDIYKKVDGIVGDFKGEYNTIYDKVTGGYNNAYGTAADGVKQIAYEFKSVAGNMNIKPTVGDIGSLIGSKVTTYDQKLSNSILGGNTLLGSEIKGLQGSFNNVINSACGGMKTTLMPNFSKIGKTTLGGTLSSLSGSSTYATASSVIQKTNTAVNFLSSIRL